MWGRIRQFDFVDTAWSVFVFVLIDFSVFQKQMAMLFEHIVMHALDILLDFLAHIFIVFDFLGRDRVIFAFNATQLIYGLIVLNWVFQVLFSRWVVDTHLWRYWVAVLSILFALNAFSLLFNKFINALLSDTFFLLKAHFRWMLGVLHTQLHLFWYFISYVSGWFLLILLINRWQVFKFTVIFVSILLWFWLVREISLLHILL